MVAVPPPSTAVLTPDPIAVCERINQLNRELRIARRLLRVTIEAREENSSRQSAESAAKPEGDSHDGR